MSWNENLLEAVNHRNLNDVRTCISHGADLNYIFHRNNYMEQKYGLHELSSIDLAVRNKDEEILKILLEQRSRISTSSLTSALLKAITYDYLPIAKLLVDAGASINYNNSLFIEAVDKGNLEFVKFLITKGANVNAGIIGKGDNNTIILGSPLIAAMNNQRDDIVELLLNSGVDLNRGEGLSNPLIWAANKNLIHWVKFLIARGADYKLNSQKDNALVYAAKRGHLDIVKYLVEIGVDVDQGEEKSPLMEAACSGFLSVVKYLSLNGADVNKCSSEGETALTYAVKGKHMDVIEYLINLGNVDVSRARQNGQGPLIAVIKSLSEPTWSCPHYDNDEKRNTIKLLVEAGGIITCDVLSYFIKKEDLEMLKYLIENGANVNRPNRNDQTPLSNAIEIKNLKIIKYLLVNGARFSIHSSLITAIESKNLEIVKLLLSHGPDVNVTNKDGATPLFQAINLGLVEVVQHLLKHPIDVNMKNQQGIPPLIAAIDSDEYDIAKLLIKHGVDLTLTDRKGNSALMKAIQHNQVDIVQMLLEKNIDVNLANSSKKTPLMQALEIQNDSIIKLLKDNGAKSINNSSLLIQYVEQNNFKAIQLLLQSGTNVDEVGESGFTPLTKSVQKDDPRMVSFLVENGASVNTLDGNLNSPLYLAALNLNFQIFEFLLKHGANIHQDIKKLEKVAEAEENFKVYLKSLFKQKKKEMKAGDFRSSELGATGSNQE